MKSEDIKTPTWVRRAKTVTWHFVNKSGTGENVHALCGLMITPADVESAMPHVPDKGKSCGTCLQRV